MALARDLLTAIAAIAGGTACGVIVLRPVAWRTAADASPDLERADLMYSMRALADRVRPLVRHTDEVLVDDEGGVALALHGTGAEGIYAVSRRLAEALANPVLLVEERGVSHPVQIGLGYATLEPAQAGVPGAHQAAIELSWQPRSLVITHLPLVAQPTRQPIRLESRRSLRATPAVRTRAGAAHSPRRTARQALRQDAERGARRHSERERRTPLHLVPLDASDPGAIEQERCRARAQALGVPFIVLPARLPSACRRAVEPGLARELRVVPVGRGRSILTVAMDDPADQAALTRLRAVTGLHIFPVLATSADLERGLRQLPE